MTWWKASGQSWVNSDQIHSLSVGETASGSGVWVIRYPGGGVLSGQWASEAAAQEAMAHLVQGFDPADLT